GVLYLAALAQKDPELRDKCCFVLFDNEEWGLLGSQGYAKWLKKNKINADDSRVINLDCIGDGDILLAAKTAGKSTVCSEVAALARENGINTVEKTSSMIFMSDHANFKNSVMVSYAKRSAFGPLYLPRIHTAKDIVCDMDKVKNLSEMLCTIAAK
ncbi:MAG: M28 family peptidase, partial [Clostridia bacterium]|nr:M28 family peptidase [Clostridia bacterium]